jgi:hypothetical protein
MKHVQHHATAAGSAVARTAGPRRRVRSALACAVALCAAVLTLTGCGGSSAKPPNPSGHAVAAATVTSSAQTAAGHARRSAGRKAGHKAASAGDRTHRPAAKGLETKAHERSAPVKITHGNPAEKPVAGTGGNTTNDDNPSATASRADSGGRPTTSGQANPCVLVSRAQASTLTGKAVSVQEAPLGPTCIYHEAGAGAPVTLAVQRLHFSTLKPHIKRLSERRISGRSAYCGVYGTEITYVLLSATRVLSISAPCEVGTKFASVALPKLLS